jgi:hypothetical protein
MSLTYQSELMERLLHATCYMLHLDALGTCDAAKTLSAGFEFMYVRMSRNFIFLSLDTVSVKIDFHTDENFFTLVSHTFFRLLHFFSPYKVTDVVN